MQIVEQFKYMTRWEESDHPIVVFPIDLKYSGDSPSGVDVISRSVRNNFVCRMVPKSLLEGLRANGLELDADWEKVWHLLPFLLERM